MDESIDNSWDDLIDVLATEDVEMPGSPPSFSASASLLDSDSIGRKRSDSHVSKKRKANPDADDIAKATEEALMQLGLDPNSEEFKLKKRQIRNRISAQSHRDRKNNHISVLENEISSKNQRITELELEVQTLKQENERLRCLLLRNDVSRTSSDLTARTDIETRYSVASSSPTHMMGGSNSSCTNSTLGSQTPDYSVSSASSASYALPTAMDVQNHVPLALTTSTVSSQSSLSASNPILKSLSFICVICVLCLCSNMSGNATVGTSNGALSSPSQPLDDHTLSAAHRRLLSIEYDAMNHSLPVVSQELSHELSSMSLGNGTALSLLSSAVESFAGNQQYKSANESHKNSSHNLRRRQLHVQRSRATTANESATKTPADIEQWLQSLPPELLAALWTGSSSPSNRLLLPSANVDGSKAPVAIHSLRKDLLPFPITQGPHEDWFSYQHRIQALSTSHVFLRDGIALFDPGFQPTEAWATALLSHYQQAQQQQSQQQQQQSQPPQRSSTGRDVAGPTGGPVSIARSASASSVDDKDLFLPVPVHASTTGHSHDAMDVDEDDERVLDALPLPDVALLPAPVAAPLKHTGSDVAAQSSSMDLVVPRLVGARSGRLLAADAVSDTPRVLKLPAMDTASASAAAARLIAESNMVTLTIPATAIKVGRSMQDSEDSSMDSLLRLFNLTSTASSSNSPTGGINNNNNGSSSSFGTSSGVSLQNAWVEMNCIVVGAKVTWQQASAGSAESRH